MNLDGAGATASDLVHCAAQRGDLAEVERLIAGGHVVNAFDEIGLTPLHYAAMNERLDVAAYLIGHGADVDAHHEPIAGNTPLGHVAGHCSLDMARLLIEAGADPTIRGWMQLNAIDRAGGRKRGDGPLIQKLLADAARRRVKPSPERSPRRPDRGPMP